MAVVPGSALGRQPLHVESSSSFQVVPAAQPLLASLCAQQVRMGRCLVPRLPALPVCLAVFQLLSPCSAEFAVVGPPEPILAMVGEDADLPCHLSLEMSAENMELMWVRPSRRQVVHVYAHGQEDTPAEQFRGRTSISREDVTAGKAALRIRSVSVSDNGTYLCYFQDGGFYAEAQVELQVAALGSDPLIDVKGYETGGIRVNCTSAGWYPQPQIQWRDARGHSLSSEVTSAAADPQGLYAASASVILEGGSGEGVSCVIRSLLLGLERSARLSIAGAFFRDTQPWTVVLLIVLGIALVVVVVVVVVAVVYLLWRHWKRSQVPSQDEGREHESQGGTQPRVNLLPEDAERGPPAAGADPRPLLQQQGAAVRSPEDSEASIELQAVVPAGGMANPQQALHTQVPSGGGSPHPHLREATNRIYSECGQEVPKSTWRRFMRFTGLEENDLVDRVVSTGTQGP
ncbi:butyrophilin subfamily 3 member A2-like isoform X2 [Phyllostomus hastatus]|uniref:butyrophilin subfamily 3 member A2-like isoform X2 n=1 Tax=Phyllostomus hastatus TaxID=9423 RepID=UPI001E681853|nr:butyrophilin subfamily 3 member A2-like isoform X2 [Phyllostomus hastatus]